MKKNTKSTLRKVAVTSGIAAVVGAAAYAMKDNAKVKKVARKIKKEIVKEAKIAYKEAKKEVAKRVRKI